MSTSYQSLQQVIPLRTLFYSSQHPRRTHVQGMQVDLGNAGLKVTDCILRTEQMVSDRLVDYATGRYSVAERFVLVLKDFVERSPGIQLTKDLIVRELEEKGLFRLPVSVSQDIGAILHTSSGAWWSPGPENWRGWASGLQKVAFIGWTE